MELAFFGSDPVEPGKPWHATIAGDQFIGRGADPLAALADLAENVEACLVVRCPFVDSDGVACALRLAHAWPDPSGNFEHIAEDGTLLT